MADYILTNKAVEDLSEIWMYTFETWSEAQADSYYYTIIQACQELADEKIKGKSYAQVRPDLFGFRVGMHIVFYRKVTGKPIEVARILHSQMDLKNRMQE
ncbi:MAG: type II toxin-antitoxin system RelE/ParE family toxin [Sediminibacterium sp.]|nr:type II toxin-antitoxin system RelE/ParE family toxin [Sediminibacterium sp.]